MQTTIRNIAFFAGRAVWLVALAVLAAGTSCAGKKEGPAALPKEDLVLAQVGSKGITIKQLQEFDQEIPEYLQSKKKAGVEKERNHLQTLIDMEILSMEAEREGLDQTPRFLKEMDKARKGKLAGIYQTRQVKVSVSPEEIAKYFQAGGFSRAVRFSRIILDSEDSARAVLAQIRRGRSFDKLARTHSVERETAVRGGDLGRYVVKIGMEPGLREGLFALSIGEVSKPLRMGTQYGIYRATAETTVTLDAELGPKLYQEVYMRQHQLALADLMARLREESRLELHREGFDAFVKTARAGALPGAEEARQIALYTYDHGAISAADLLDAARAQKNKGPDLKDREQLIAFAERVLVPDAMAMEAAVRAGVDKEEEVAGWLERHRQKLLIMALRGKALEGKITITDEEVRDYYERRPDKYLFTKQMEVQEVLVETEEEALRLKQQAQYGTPLGELARTKSIRPLEQRDEEGKLYFTPSERPIHGDLVAAAEEAPVGELTGPVKTKGGYSVFKVLSSRFEKEPLEKAQKRIRATINWMRKQEVFEAFMEELRQRYAPQVTISEDNLKAAFGAG